MGLLKYREENQTEDGTPLHWGRAMVDGAPFRGKQVPMWRDEEFETFGERVKNAKTRVFQMWVEADVTAYNAVMDRIANGWWTLLRDIPMPVPTKESFAILCTWTENYIEAPADRVQSTLGG